MAILGIAGSGILIANTPTATADSATTLSATIPAISIGGSSIWDGRYVYIFGGHDGASRGNAIVRYDPTTDTVTTMSATLPTARSATAAAWDGRNAYIFGGNDASGRLNQILRYNTTTDTLTTLASTLPVANNGMSAIWNGLSIYLFGGFDSSVGYTNSIVRYTPGVGASTMSATLPSGRISTSAIWDGQNAYVFGGSNPGKLNSIVRYNTVTNTVTNLGAGLPSARDGTSAIWNGHDAYIFGGAGSGLLSDILRYNTTTGTVTTMGATLPTARSTTIAQWNGTSAFLLGGYTGSRITDIVRYTLEPGAPQNVQAQAGSDAGEITVTWAPPAANSYSSLVTYHVLRSDTPTGTYSEVGTTDSSTREYHDSGLGNTVQKCYKVQAENAAGERGPTSDHACATTYDVPCAPTLAVAEGPGAGQVRLTWTDGCTGGTGVAVSSHNVQRRPASGASTFFPITGGSPYVDSGRGDNVTWCYRLTAVSSVELESAPSAEQCATTYAPPSKPLNLQATTGSSPGTVHLTWERPNYDGRAPPINKYWLYWGTTQGGPKPNRAPVTVSGDPSAVTYDHSPQVVSTTPIYYQVTAVNSAAPDGLEGDPSNEASATPAGSLLVTGPPPPPPPGIVGTELLNQTVPIGGGGTSTPPIDVDIVHVAGQSNGTNNYDVNVNLLGNELPTITILTGGLVTQPIDVRVLHVPAIPLSTPGYNVTIVVTERHDPTSHACVIGVGGCKLDAPVDPFNPSWILTSGADSQLIVTVTITDANGLVVASQTVTLVYLGQVFSTFPYVYP